MLYGDYLNRKEFHIVKKIILYTICGCGKYLINTVRVSLTEPYFDLQLGKINKAIKMILKDR